MAHIHSLHPFGFYSTGNSSRIFSFITSLNGTNSSALYEPLVKLLYNSFSWFPLFLISLRSFTVSRAALFGGSAVSEIPETTFAWL